MRIGMITGEYPPMQGGVGAFSLILAGEMAAQGHELFILSRSGTAATSPHIHLTSEIDHWGMSSLTAARRWAKRHALEVVNIQYQTAAYGMSPFIHFLPDALRPLPVVTTFHDLRFPYLFPKAGRLRNAIVRRLADHSSGVIATNPEDAARINHPCSTLIPIGSNILAPASLVSAPFRAAAGAAPDDFLIVYFGLVNRSKGLDTLLHAVSQLRDLPVRLALIGAVAGSSDPTNAAYLREIDLLIDQLDLSPLLHRTGYLDDAAVSGYLAAADAIALTFADGASYRRGTLMAALQHGGAIVTTTPQVTVPAFVDGENLRLVPPGDAPALADALRQLYAHPNERETLRRGARALSRQFEWSEIARATAAFYQRVIEASV